MFRFNFFNKWWDKFKDWEKNVSPGLKKAFWGILFLLIISAMFTVNLIPNQIDLKVGQVSRNDIIASKTMTFTDQEKTEELKRIAASSAPRVYEEDNTADNVIREKIHGLFAAVRIKAEKPEAQEEAIIQLKKEYGEEISDKTIALLIEDPLNIRDRLEEEAISILDSKLGERILPEDLLRVKDELAQEAMEMDLSKEYRLALANILENMIRPNMTPNEEATRKKRQEVVEQVEPVRLTVRQGEVIVRKGDVVTEDDIKILEALGLMKTRVKYLNIIGMIIIILSITIIANYYFVRYKPKFMQEQKNLIFLELMVVIILVIAKIINYFQISYLIYLVPVAMASILTAVLINTDIAVMLTVFLSLLVGLVFNNDFNVVISSFIGGLVGIFSVARVNQRNDLVRAGFNVSGVLVIVILGLTMNMAFSNWIYILWSILIGVLNGILVAILANGLLPYLENTFGMTSSVKLLELSNPSQPLLKKLLVEAPGTYHHSVIVGNLAETAADNIGANSLLTRVGANYHDIGKIKRPYFFTDNQFGGGNPHDKLSPNLSSLIIKSHVKDGVEMAREYNLPESIIDIIKEHHGTNLISFFYQDAMKDNKHDSVEESDFHYDGPKPQSRESAIIMLADIVEASLRSKQFNKGNHNRIEGIVRELIREKLTEGQLDESELTLKDLDIIVDSFVKVLTGIYHQRVDYPEKLIKEMKRADRSDKNRDK